MSSTHVWIHTGRPASVNNKVCCKIQTDVEQQKSSPLKTGLVCVQMSYKCMWVNWVWCVCVCSPSPSPPLRWLPCNFIQICGFQVCKLERYKTTNVTEATRREAPKPSQKLRWLPWHVNYWRGCRRRVGCSKHGCWWDAGSQRSRCYGDASWRRASRSHLGVTW